MKTTLDASSPLKTLLEKTKTPKTEKIAVRGYEKVLKVEDADSGLTALIAIHNTALGPALGGTRIYPYASFEAGLKDVLRLSEGMTYKSAIAGVGFGGGKSVIFADPAKDKTPELLFSFGRAVEALQGNYICAEDVGCSVDDVSIIHQATRYVVGLSHEKSSGNPARFTAWGVFRGILATVAQLFQKEPLEGVHVAIQGLGSVGTILLDLLFWSGARLSICDVDEKKAQRLAEIYGAKHVSSESIFDVECDVFVPCAIGGILNQGTIARLKCKGIAGGANNQLQEPQDAVRLKERGILYAPDFIINAGGLLNVAAELDEEGYHPANPRLKTHQIYDTLLAVYEIAEKNRETTHEAAFALADYRIQYGIGRRFLPPVFHHSV